MKKKIRDAIEYLEEIEWGRFGICLYCGAPSEHGHKIICHLSTALSLLKSVMLNEETTKPTDPS